jgi:hypothetical protein
LKHLVKKYVRLADLTEGAAEVLNNAPVDEKELTKIADKDMEGYNAYIITEDNKMVQTFKFENNGKNFLIPEPDPIVIYFDSARHFHSTIKRRRNELFSKLSMDYKNFTAVNGDFYWYFSNVSSFIIFLFLSLEAFINKSIPLDFEYKKKVQNKRTEIYDNFQIQRHIEFLEKIKKVLPQVTGSNFAQDYSHKFDMIRELKKFRDEIVHTKSFEATQSSNFYEDLYVVSLNFDFDKVLLAVRDCINYYQPNLIEECNCGKDE